MTPPAPDLAAVRRDWAGFPPSAWSSSCSAPSAGGPTSPARWTSCTPASSVWPRSCWAARRRRTPNGTPTCTASTANGCCDPTGCRTPRCSATPAYADRFAGDLAGVARRIDYLRELGVDYLHLMPLLLPRPGPDDGGYAVADFRTVRPDLGTVDDLRELTYSLRGAGISLVLDLVLNHVAREHEWARRAIAGEQRYRDYFLLFSDRTGRTPTRRACRGLPRLRPRQLHLRRGGGRLGLDHLQRLAVGPELGQTPTCCASSPTWCCGWPTWASRCCVSMRSRSCGSGSGPAARTSPEVHAITQVLRTVARIAAPAVAFKAEAIVSPPDLMPYLGVGSGPGG